MKNIPEIWVAVLGHENYEVSDQGRIRNSDGNILTKDSSREGYRGISLNKKSFMVHRIVMQSFVGHSDLDIDHINGIKHDNRLKNLEYVTARQNSLRHYAKTNPYPGTFFVPQTKKWIARIKIKKVFRNLGTYADRAQASRAYLEMANMCSLIGDDATIEYIKSRRRTTNVQ